MKKKIWIALFLLGMLCMAVPVQAAEQPAAVKGRILFVPHDGRPISDAQTADVVRGKIAKGRSVEKVRSA